MVTVVAVVSTSEVTAPRAPPSSPPSSDSSACACPWPRPRTSETTIQANAVPTPMRASRTILGSCEVAISTFTSHDERAARSERIVREGAWTCDDTGSVSGLSRPSATELVPDARRGRRWRCPRNCAQGTKHSPTFNPDFNHIPLHRLCNTQGLVRSGFLRDCARKAASSPQRLFTGMSAFHAGSPQSYPQAVLRVSEAVLSVGCGSLVRVAPCWTRRRGGGRGTHTGVRRGAGVLRHPAMSSCTLTCVPGEPCPPVP